MELQNTNSIKENTYNYIKQQIKENNLLITLALIQTNTTKEINSYIKGITKMCRELNYKLEIYNLVESREKDIITKIQKLNKNPNITAIVLPLPIRNNLNKEKIINTITPEKDADGLTDHNYKRLLNNKNTIIPATPLGIITYLNKNKINLSNKKILIINTSHLIGKPLSHILKESSQEVILANSKTNNLKNLLKNADIVITATGHAHFINESMVKENSIIFDIGLSIKNNKLTGDFKDNHTKKINLVNSTSNLTISSLALNILTITQLNNNK